MARPDFKSGEGLSQSLVGSTPTSFRQHDAWQASRRIFIEGTNEYLV